MATLKQLEHEVNEIKARNRRVDMEKLWETSFLRRAIIGLLTYAAIVVFFIFAELPKPFLNAIVPTLGFLLSTLTLSFFRKMWIKSFM